MVWSGQGGTDIFFQNELPYDPPNQSAWMAAPNQDGYPAFLVVFIDTKATLYDSRAFEVPDTRGVQFHDVFAVWIGGSGGDDSIINGVGGPATSTNPGQSRPVDVASYP